MKQENLKFRKTKAKEAIAFARKSAKDARDEIRVLEEEVVAKIEQSVEQLEEASMDICHEDIDDVMQIHELSPDEAKGALFSFGSRNKSST